MKLAGLLVAALAALALPDLTEARPLSGRLEIRHKDDFKQGRAHTRYRLVRKHGRPIVLRPLVRPRVPSGTKVTVNGRRVIGMRQAAVAAGPRKTAVFLVNFATDTRTPWTPAHVRERMFTGADSVNAFYTEESYGDVSLTGKTSPDGDVFGWYTLATPTAGCDVDAWAQLARQAAVADGFSATGYQHLIYVFPQQPSCGGWAGLGEVPGRQSWLNGTVSVRVAAHELGHNMGLDHASSLSCNADGAPVAISSSCATDEYGDPFDVMGSSLRHNNAWHLRQIGFMPAANVQVASAPGTYSLTSAIARGAGTQLLRVPVPGSSPARYYDLELRTSGGVFDDFLSTDPAVNGVSVHLDPEPSVITQSLLIDTTPGSPGGFADAPLKPGQTFSDGEVTVSVVSIASGVATVVVNGTAPPVDVTPPSAPVVTAVAEADRIVLQWQPSTDATSYRVSRGGIQVATTSETSWTDSEATPGATYLYRVTAVDAAGNVAPSAVVSAAVPSSPPPPPPVVEDLDPPRLLDGVPPDVRILAPGRRLRRRGSVLIKGAASDNVAVARTEVYLDGVIARVVNGPRVSWRWRLRRARVGRHVVLVRAYDTNGNSAQAIRRVRVVR